VRQTPVPPRTWEAFGVEPVVIDTTYVRPCFSATPLRGPAPLAVQFNAGCSIGRALSFSWDFGDAGATATGMSASHTFQNPGTYTVTLTARNADTTKTTQVPVIALDPAQTPLKLLGTPIVSITAPSGAGSRDLNIIRDEVYPTAGGFIVGYDTYNGQAHAEDYFGYTFGSQYRFTGLDHFYGPRDPEPQGGVFESIRVQVRVAGVWTDVTGLTYAQPYNGASAVSFDSVQLTFTPMIGDGIRIIGAPRGGMWVGCAELDVYGTPASSAVVAPQGFGSAAMRVGVSRTGVTLCLARAAVKVFIRDAQGRMVRCMPVGNLSRIVWDRKNAAGVAVNPGVYLVSVSGVDGRVERVVVSLTR
jgi:PKD repeat protein